MEYAAYHDEQAAVWSAYQQGTPVRVPVSISASDSIILLEPELNPHGYTFQDCFADPGIMFAVQLQAQHWALHHLPGDHPYGLPDEWVIGPYFQNVTDAAWLGAPLHFYAVDGMPVTRQLLTDDNKHLLFDRGIPDPFSGILGEGKRFYEHYRERAARETFHDRPIKVAEFHQGFSSDGPFTTACNLRGATEFCLDLYEDPEYAQQLLDFIVEAILTRRKAWLEYYGLPLSRGGLWMPDDSITLLSCAAYRELVLPHHKRLSYTFRAPGQQINVHLCGDSSRHFRLMRDELEVGLFDTGYPIDHGWVRRQVGPEVTIQGVLQHDVLLHGTAAEVAAETRRVLHSGVMAGGKFILCAGVLGGAGWRQPLHQEPSRTPLDNLWVMYETCRAEGGYAGTG